MKYGENRQAGNTPDVVIGQIESIRCLKSQLPVLPVENAVEHMAMMYLELSLPIEGME